MTDELREAVDNARDADRLIDEQLAQHDTDTE